MSTANATLKRCRIPNIGSPAGTFVKKHLDCFCRSNLRSTNQSIRDLNSGKFGKASLERKKLSCWPTQRPSRDVDLHRLRSAPWKSLRRSTVAGLDRDIASRCQLSCATGLPSSFIRRYDSKIAKLMRRNCRSSSITPGEGGSEDGWLNSRCLAIGHHKKGSKSPGA